MHQNQHTTERLIRDIHDGPLPTIERMASGGGGDLTEVAQYRELSARLSTDLRSLLGRRSATGSNLESVLGAVVADLDATSELDVTLEIDADCAALPMSVWPGIERVARTALASVTTDPRATRARVSVSRAARNRIVLEVAGNGRTLDRSHFAATARLRRTLSTGIRNFGSSLAIVSTKTGTSIQLMGPGGAPTHGCATTMGGQS